MTDDEKILWGDPDAEGSAPRGVISIKSGVGYIPLQYCEGTEAEIRSAGVNMSLRAFDRALTSAQAALKEKIPRKPRRSLIDFKGSVSGFCSFTAGAFRDLQCALFGIGSLAAAERHDPLCRAGMPALKARVLARIAARNAARRAGKAAKRARATARAVLAYRLEWGNR